MDLKEAKYSNQRNSHHPWEYAKTEVIYTLVKYYLPPLIEKRCVIADIGCGDVFLIEQLSKRLPQAVFIAVDNAFTDEMLKYYRDRYKGDNIYIFNSLHDASKIINESVDLVLLLDVIEHIENETSFFMELTSQLRINETTSIITTAPAFQSLFTSHDVFLNHYRRYNNKRLAEVIIKSNLKPIDSGYFFFSLIPIRAIQKLVEQIKKPRLEKIKGIGGWKENKIKDSIIKTILLLDFRISFALKKLGIKIPGLSNYIICTKSV